MKDGDKPGISWVHVEMVELSDLLGKCGFNNMVRALISNKDRSNFVELCLKPAARADKQSSVNQCSHKIDFLLHRAKGIPVYVLASKGGFSIHRCDKSSFVLLN